MNKHILRFIFLLLLNYLLIKFSPEIDIEQFKDDLEDLRLRRFFNSLGITVIVCVFVSLLTDLLIIIFNPFIEIYLLHFQKNYFYFLINLVSISTVFIIFRIYGYSRLYLILYLILSSLVLRIIDKVAK